MDLEKLWKQRKFLKCFRAKFICLSNNCAQKNRHDKKCRGTISSSEEDKQKNKGSNLLQLKCWCDVNIMKNVNSWNERILRYSRKPNIKNTPKWWQETLDVTVSLVRRNIYILLVWQRATIPMFNKYGKIRSFHLIDFSFDGDFPLHSTHLSFYLFSRNLFHSSATVEHQYSKNWYLFGFDVANDVFIWNVHFSPFTRRFGITQHFQ